MADEMEPNAAQVEVEADLSAAPDNPGDFLIFLKEFFAPFGFYSALIRDPEPTQYLRLHH